MRSRWYAAHVRHGAGSVVRAGHVGRGRSAAHGSARRSALGRPDALPRGSGAQSVIAAMKCVSPQETMKTPKATKAQRNGMLRPARRANTINDSEIAT